MITTQEQKHHKFHQNHKLGKRKKEKKSYLIINLSSFLQFIHNSIMNKTRISPANAIISRGIAHVLPLIPLNTRHNNLIKLLLLFPISHVPFRSILRHEHHSHFVIMIRERQMDLLRAAAGGESELLRSRKKVRSARERVVVVVMMLVVDLRFGPPENPEGVIGSEVD